MSNNIGGIGDIIIMIGIVLGMYGVSQALAPPLKRKFSRRIAVGMIVVGLALAYAGLAITGDTNALTEIMQQRENPAPPVDKD